MTLRTLKLDAHPSATTLAIPQHTILLGYAGSLAHGTYIPNTDPNSIDDVDLLGVAVGDPAVYFGLQQFEQQLFHRDIWDSTVYEIRKFFRLLLKQNPNVCSLLWLRHEDYLIKNYSGTLLVDNRQLWVSKQAATSFIGYAYGQLRKMTHYAYEGYMGEKRKTMVDRYGFDVKNASHLIRLLRMLIEFLDTGEFRVYRADAAELKTIKTGGWTLAQVKAEAYRLFDLARTAEDKSALPPKPQADKIEELLMDIIQYELRLQKTERQDHA